jgi:DNA-binding response OmpR family regulator
VRAQIIAAIRDEGVEAHEADGCDSGLERAVELHPRIMVIGPQVVGESALNLIRSLRRMRLGCRCTY